MFGQHKKRHLSDLPVETELPITPMLDMTFQLMAFFIMSYHPMKTEGQLPILLPKDDASKQSQASPDIPPDEADDFKLRVFSQNGDIGSIALKTGAGEEAIPDQDRMNALYNKLKSIPKPKDKPLKITIEAAADLKYSRLIDLMDLCKKAEFESVGIGPLEKPKAKAAEPAKK